MWKDYKVIGIVAGLLTALAAVAKIWKEVDVLGMLTTPVTVAPIWWVGAVILGGTVALLSGFFLVNDAIDKIAHRIAQNSPEVRFQKLTDEINRHRINTEISIQTGSLNPSPSSFVKERISLRQRLSDLGIQSPDLKSDQSIWLVFLIMLEEMAENQTLDRAKGLLEIVDKLSEESK